MNNKQIEELVDLMFDTDMEEVMKEKNTLEYIHKLQQENEQLKEDLRVSQSNEETYCLEMQEITKILGLDEHTLFDDVKDYAKQLKEELKKYINSSDFVYDELYKKRETIEKILGDKE